MPNALGNSGRQRDCGPRHLLRRERCQRHIAGGHGGLAAPQPLVPARPTGSAASTLVGRSTAASGPSRAIACSSASFWRP